MKILVTGGAGFIGSNFIRHMLALDTGYSIVNYDKLTYAGNLENLISIAENPNYRFAKGDICNIAAVEAAIVGCDAVIHFAAESHVDRSIYEPAPVIETNITGTFILLQVARKLNAGSSCTFLLMKCMGTFSPVVLRTKTHHWSQAAPTPLPKQALIFLFVRMFGPSDFQRSSREHQTTTVRISSRRNFCR